eukprot:316497_1
MLALLALIINTAYGLDKQEGLSENFVNFFPFQQLISIIDTDFYENIIYDCSLLDLESPQCELDCQYYNNISALYNYINELINNGDNILADSLITNISSWYAMGSSAFNYFDVGNPLQCEYYYGTYCYTPITVKSDITLYQHGCCIPGSCKDSDAEKVLTNNAFCFQSFNTTIYNKVYKNNNISIFGYELDTNLNIQCSASSDRNFNSIGIYFVFGIFIFFIILIFIASIIRNCVGATPSVNMTDIFIDDNMSDTDAICVYFVSIFAIQDNWNLLLDRRNVITFEYLDGIRVWSFIWIICMASTQIYFIVGITDLDTILPATLIKGETSRNDWNGYITNSWLSLFAIQFPIDTFFWLSGFLGVLSLHKILMRQELKYNENNNNNEGCCQSVCPCCKYGCCRMITFAINSWIRRYLRLMPMALYVMLITAYLLDQISSGYHVIERDVYNKCCANTFWQNLLLIRNFIFLSYDSNNCVFGCMSHIWYICCDFQLFLLLPIFVYIFNKLHKIGGMIICLSFSILGIIIRLFLGFYFEFSANLWLIPNDPINDGDQIYMSFNKPWSRMSGYYLGAFTMLIFIYIDQFYNDSNAFSKLDNQIYLKTQNWTKFKLTKYKVILLQTISIGIMASLLGIPYNNIKNQPDNNNWNVWQNALWYGFAEPLWCASLSLFTFAIKYRPNNNKNNKQSNIENSKSGNDNIDDDDDMNKYSQTFIIRILSGSAYEILSKLTYTMYLIHFFILRWWSLTLSQPVYFNLFNILNLSISTWIICAIFALILWLVIEKPIFNLIEVIHSWCKNKENIYSFKVENKKNRKKRKRNKKDYLSA